MAIFLIFGVLLDGSFDFVIIALLLGVVTGLVFGELVVGSFDCVVIGLLLGVAIGFIFGELFGGSFDLPPPLHTLQPLIKLMTRTTVPTRYA